MSWSSTSSDTDNIYAAILCAIMTCLVLLYNMQIAIELGQLLL